MLSMVDELHDEWMVRGWTAMHTTVEQCMIGTLCFIVSHGWIVNNHRCRTSFDRNSL